MTRGVLHPRTHRCRTDELAPPSRDERERWTVHCAFPVKRLRAEHRPPGAVSATVCQWQNRGEEDPKRAANLRPWSEAADGTRTRGLLHGKPVRGFRPLPGGGRFPL